MAYFMRNPMQEAVFREVLEGRAVSKTGHIVRGAVDEAVKIVPGASSLTEKQCKQIAWVVARTWGHISGYAYEPEYMKD